MLTRFVEKRWYGKPGVLLGLAPLACLAKKVAMQRRRKIQKNTPAAAVPVIVIGNISVGGTGKTPVIIELVKWLHGKGFKPGVISKGYGRQTDETLLVESNHTAQQVGDEPLLIAQQTQSSVAVGSDRAELVKLLREQGCQVILSDDGMQDPKLVRDFEVVVIDGQRLFGNGKMLPVGPLREPINRLNSVDAILVNGHQVPKFDFDVTGLVKVVPTTLENLSTGETYSVENFNSTFRSKNKIYAVAGLGNPGKFFNSLKALDIHAIEKPFPDHHPFSVEDFQQFGTDSMVIMTGKDAVKCRAFAQPNWWVLNIKMQLPNELLLQVENLLNPN